MNDTRLPFFNLGIRGRLLLGFALLTLILAIVIGFISVKIDSSEGAATRVIQTELPMYEAALNLNLYLYQAQASLRGFILSKNPKYKTEVNRAWENIDQIFQNKVLAEIISKETEQQWITIKLLSNQLKAAMLQALASEGSMTTVNAQLAERELLSNKIFDLLDGPVKNNGIRSGGLLDYYYHQVEKGSQVIMNDIDYIRTFEYSLLFLTIIASIIIGLWTSHKIVVPLKNAIKVAQRIANGDRNVEVISASNDETGELLTALAHMQESIKQSEKELMQSEANTRDLFEKVVQTAQSFSQHSSRVASGDLTTRLKIENEEIMGPLGNDLNTMTDSLANITKQITEACHNMVGTLDEVRHGVDVQATGASEQASSINQITASLEEIEKSSNQTMDKAKALGESASRTREKGQLGLEAVEQSISGMKIVREKVQTIAQTILELSNQTQQVGEITALVNTLSQQSKMLALNASIEAAKAGDAGKGFAVVASEVKTLAEQSEQATSQVQKILEEIRRATEKAVMVTEEGTKGVDHGTDLVEQTGEIVRSLSDVIHETTIASQQIEAAIRQEGVGIEQITSGMNEINQVTGSFVDNVKQTTEAIGNLSMIAKNLKDHIDTYKL